MKQGWDFPQSAADADDTGHVDAGNEDIRRLHRQASRLGAEWLSLPLADFWTRLAREQAALDVAAGTYSTHQADLEALRTLRRQEANWEAALRNALENAALSWRDSEIPGIGAQAPTLSLMSELELSAHLHAQQWVPLLEKSLGPVLEDCDRRVAAIAVRLGLRADAGNPWGAAGFLRAFVDALPLDEFSPTLVPIVFDHLGQRLPPMLREVLPRVSALLEGGGVMPLPVAAAPRAPDIVGAGKSAEVVSIDPHVEEAAGPPPEAPVLGMDTLANLRARPAVGPNPPDSGDLPARGEPGLPRYRDIVHEHLAQWRARAQADGSWDVSRPAAPGMHTLRSAEVMTVASVLQGEDPTPFANALAQTGGATLQRVIREEMLKAAVQFGFERDNTSFNPEDEDAIDLVAILFNRLAENNDLLPRGTRMFGKLVLPYVKVAMIDDSLFNRRSHPARRLLDALTETCDGNAGESVVNREMLDRAEAVVDQVVARFQEDQAIFELAAQELRDYLAQQRQRAEVAERRMAEALHGRERLHHARSDAHAELAQRLQHAPLSAPTHDFLEQFWQKALVQVWLRYGADSPRHRAMLELADALLALDAAGAQSRITELARGFVAQMPALRDCLALCGRIGQAAEEAIARLATGLSDPNAERGIRDIAQPPPEEILVEREAGLRVACSRESSADPLLVARLRKLRVGQGLRLREEEGRDSAARIAWVSPLTARFLIVNRRGMRKLVVSPEELAMLVESGQATIRAIDAPVDHAMRQVWEELRNAGSPQA